MGVKAWIKKQKKKAQKSAQQANERRKSSESKARKRGSSSSSYDKVREKAHTQKPSKPSSSGGSSSGSSSNRPSRASSGTQRHRNPEASRQTRRGNSGASTASKGKTSWETYASNAFKSNERRAGAKRAQATTVGKKSLSAASAVSAGGKYIAQKHAEEAVKLATDANKRALETAGRGNRGKTGKTSATRTGDRANSAQKSRAKEFAESQRERERQRNRTIDDDYQVLVRGKDGKLEKKRSSLVTAGEKATNKLKRGAEKTLEEGAESFSGEKKDYSIPIYTKHAQAKAKEEAKKSYLESKKDAINSSKQVLKDTADRLDKWQKENGYSDDTLIQDEDGSTMTVAEYRQKVMADTRKSNEAATKEWLAGRRKELTEATKDAGKVSLSHKDIYKGGVKIANELVDYAVPYMGTGKSAIKSAEAIVKAGKAAKAGKVLVETAENGQKVLTKGGKKFIQDALREGKAAGKPVEQTLNEIKKTIAKSNLKTSVKKELIANAEQDLFIGTGIDVVKGKQEGLEGKEFGKYMAINAAGNVVLGGIVSGVAGRTGKVGKREIAKGVKENVNTEYVGINALTKDEGKELVTLQQREKYNLLSGKEGERLKELETRAVTNRAGIAQMDNKGRVVLNDGKTVSEVMSPREEKELANLEARQAYGTMSKSDEARLGELAGKAEAAHEAVKVNSKLAVQAAKSGSYVDLDTLDSAVNFNKKFGSSGEVNSARSARTDAAMRQFNTDRTTAKIITTAGERSDGALKIRPMDAETAGKIFGAEGEDFSFEGVTLNVNGTKVVLLNPESTRGVKLTLAHELTHHVIDAGGKFISTMKKFAKGDWEKQFAETKAPYDSYMEKVKNGDMNPDEQAFTTDGINLDEETACDLMANYIDRVDFFDHLLTEDATAFEKMKAYVKNILRKDKDFAKNEDFKTLSDMFEEGYRNSFKDSNVGGPEFALSEDKKTLIAGRGSANDFITLKKVKQAEKSGNAVALAKIQKQTGWYKNGDKWQFDINISNMKFKNGIQSLAKKGPFDSMIKDEVGGIDAVLLNYPDLRWVSVGFGDTGGEPYALKTSGKYLHGIILDSNLPKVKLPKKDKNKAINDAMSSALQDVLHQIDEGKIARADEDEYAEDLFDDEGIKKLTNLSKPPGYKPTMNPKPDNVDDYKQIFAEATARANDPDGKEVAEREAYQEFRRNQEADFKKMNGAQLNDFGKKIHFVKYDGSVPLEQYFDELKKVVLDNGAANPAKPTMTQFSKFEEFRQAWVADKRHKPAGELLREMRKNDYVSWAIDRTMQGMDNLTAEEAAIRIAWFAEVGGVSDEEAAHLVHAVWKYTSANQYSEPGSYDITVAQKFDKFVERAPAYQMSEGETLYHGVSSDAGGLIDRIEEIWKQYGPGFVLSSNKHQNSGMGGAASSWTNSEKTAKSFARFGFSQKTDSILVRCHNNVSGVPINHISYYGHHESEVFFGTRAEYTVVNFERRPGPGRDAILDVLEKAPQSAKPKAVFSLSKTLGEPPDASIVSRTIPPKEEKAVRVNGFPVVNKKGKVTPKAASEYMKAAKEGNVEYAQKLLDAVFESRGYTYDVHHGTQTAGFTEFNPKEAKAAARHFPKGTDDNNIIIFSSEGKETAASYAGTSKTTPVHSEEEKRKVQDEAVALLKKHNIYKASEFLDYKYSLDGGMKTYFETLLSSAPAKNVPEEDASALLRYGERIDALGNRGIYEGKLMIEHPLVIDANGMKQWHLKFEPLGDGDKYTTNDIAIWARENGYDGVIFKGLEDWGPADNIYAVFDSRQFKGRDPVTYRDDGSIIPLDERANPENMDIRFSLSGNKSTTKTTATKPRRVNNIPVTDGGGKVTAQATKAFDKAYKEGNRKLAKQLVDAVLEEKGYNISAYHGSPVFGFTKFDLGALDDGASIFASKSAGTAGTYAPSSDVMDIEGNASPPFTKAEREEKINRFLDIFESLGVDTKDSFGIFREEFDEALKYGQVTDFFLGRFPTVRSPKTGYQVVAPETAERFRELDDLSWALDVGTDGDGGIYRAMLKMDNPLVVDAKGSRWSEISTDFMESTGKPSEATTNTRGVSKYARENGYDGVIIQNVKDHGDFASPDAPDTDTIYIVFDSAQFKSSDPFTYRDDGSLIPLSERGDVSNPDIRFALSKKTKAADTATPAEAKTAGQALTQFESVEKALFVEEKDLSTEAIEKELREAMDGLNDAEAKKFIEHFEEEKEWCEPGSEAAKLYDDIKGLAEGISSESKATKGAGKSAAEGAETPPEKPKKRKHQKKTEPKEEAKGEEAKGEEADAGQDTKEPKEWDDSDINGIISRARRNTTAEEMNKTAERQFNAVKEKYGGRSEFADLITFGTERGAFGKIRTRKLDEAVERANAQLDENGVDDLYDSYISAAFEAEPYDLRAKANVLLKKFEEMLDLGDGDKQEIMKRYTKVVEKMSSITGFSSKSMLAQKAFLTSTGEGQARAIYREIAKLEKMYKDRIKGGKLSIPEDDIKRLLTASDADKDKILKEINYKLWEQIPASLFERLNEYRHCFMLFNPKTHGRNVFGNQVFKMIRGLSYELEAAALRSARAQKRLKTFGDVELDEHGRVIVDKVRVKKSEVNDNRGLLYNEFRAIYDKSESRNKYIELGRPDGVPTVKWKAMQKVIDANYHLLEKEDLRWALVPAFNKAYVSWCKARCPEKTPLREFMENMTEAQKTKARHYALSEGEYATFRDACAFSTWLTRKKQKLAGMDDTDLLGKLGYGALDALLEGTMPFVKTPVNIFRRSVEYSPGAFLASLYKVRAAKTAEEYVNAVHLMCTGLTGTGIAVIGGALAHFGLVTVKAGEESGDEYYDREMGFQDYSLRIKYGDGKESSWTLDWMSPTAMSLFAGASIVDLLESGNFGGTEAVNALFSITSPFTDTSFMSSPKETMERFAKNATTDSATGKDVDFLSATAQLLAGDIPKNYVSGFFPQLVAQTAGATDVYNFDPKKTFGQNMKAYGKAFVGHGGQIQRDTSSTAENTFVRAWQTAGRQLINKVPVVRQMKLNPKLNYEGDDIKTGDNVAVRLLNAFVNPASVKQITTNETDRELIAIRNEYGEKVGKDDTYATFYRDLFGNPYYALEDGKRMTYNEMYEYGKTSRKEQNAGIQKMLKSDNYGLMDVKMKMKELDMVHTIGNIKADHDTYGVDYSLKVMKKHSESDSKIYKDYKSAAGKDADKEAFYKWRLEKERLIARTHASGDDLYRAKGMTAIAMNDENLLAACDLKGSKATELVHWWKDVLKENGGKRKAAFETITKEMAGICNITTAYERKNDIGSHSISTGSIALGYQAANDNKQSERAYRGMGYFWNAAQAGGGLQLKYNKDKKYNLANYMKMDYELKQRLKKEGYKYDKEKDEWVESENKSTMSQKEIVMDYIDNTLKVTDKDEAACLYQCLYLKGHSNPAIKAMWKNPYKETIDDHLEWNENKDDEWGGIERNGSGRRGRRRGHRRGGRGGGGGGGAGAGTGTGKDWYTFAGEVYDLGGSGTSKAKGVAASKEKVTDFTNKSTLNAAYRRRARARQMANKRT